MAKMTISQFRRTFAKGSAPDRHTVIRRIERGEYAGGKEGGRWYVDPERVTPQPTANDVATVLLQQLAARRCA